MDRDRLKLLISTARLYWEDGLSQAEIAERIGYSRSMVSRLLDSARSEGVVTIHVGHPLERALCAEEKLKREFGLEDARVSLQDAVVSPREALCLAGSYLSEALGPDDVIAVSNGRTVSSVVEACPHLSRPGATVVQAIGAIARENNAVDAPEISSRLAKRLGCSYRILPVPLVVRDSSLAVAWRKEAAVSMTLAMASHADVFLTGIGAVNTGEASIFDDDLTDSERRELEVLGAVGHIGGHHVSADGLHVDSSLCQRILAIPFERMAAIRRVVAVAWGESKVPAIRAALRTGAVDCLVTDFATVRGVLGDEG